MKNGTCQIMRCARRVSPLIMRRNSTWGSPLLYRDVFVFDDEWKFDKWHDCLISGKTFQHPDSLHISSKYAMHQFNHSKFHFNEGEFSLTIHSAQLFNGSVQGSNPTESVMSKDHAESKKLPFSKTRRGTHSIIMWPDRLIIERLRNEHVQAIMSVAMKAGPPLTIERVESVVNSVTRADGTDTESRVKVSSLDAMFIAVSAVIPSMQRDASVQRSLITLKSFTDALDNIQPSPAPLLAMTAELRGHRRGQSVLLLPPLNRELPVTAGTKEDAFALLEGDKQIREVLRSYWGA